MFLTIVPASAINSFAESLSGVKTIDNGYIRVYVSEENGGFSVSLAEGDRLKKSDNNKKLLYHDGEYDTSFISLKIGEGSEAKEYLFGGKCDTSEPLKVTQAKENGEIKAEWAVNNIRFTQVISLAADASNEHGMVSLSLFAENNGEEKKIRARVLLDTYLGNSDFGYYMLSDENSNVTAVSSERVVESYGGLSLQSFYASDSLTDPSVEAYSVNATILYKAAFAHWNNLAASLFEFEADETVSVYYENYLDAAKFGSSAICTEFDGELYTSDARTGVYKGKAIFTKIEQGEPVSLIPYDENGARVDEENFTDGTISLIWNSAAGIGQTLAGMVFKLAYGQMGTMKVEVEKTEKIGDQIKRIKETKNCGVVSFSASLDLSFTGAAGDPNAEGTKRDTYWSKAKDIWQYYREDQSLYQYTYNAGRINQLRDFSKIDEHTEFDDGSKKVNASVMVPDVLFGCGEGFVGVHFKVNVGLKNFVSSLPSIQGEIEVNTINDWSFGVSGEVELATFTLEAKVSFKSHDDIPVPDELYVFVGGFKPGINIDGFGVVWITGAGGGVKNLYDTIFLSQGVPPLKLLLSTSFSIVQVLSCKKATLAVGLTGISLNAEDITVMDIPALTVINKMGLSAEWYPGLDLRANIVVNLFEGIIYGDYYIRAIYSREDVVNGAAVSKTEIHVGNKNTPDAATILSAAPAGNLMFALKLGDAPVTGYKVTVYNEDMTLTELSDMDFKKEDGNLITVGGSYSAAAEDGSEVTTGLSGGKSYYIGVTPYNEAAGSAVYGKEVLSEKLFLPEMTTPTVDITADKEKKTRTEEVITESGRSLSETLVFTENDVTFTAAISEKASGTWRLDSGGETEFINSDSVKIALSEITEGKHSLTVKGKDLEGDGFIATYVFTVDTLSPRLLAKSPVNGAMYKDGAIEFSGVTDSEAIFTVKCDDVTVIDGVPVSEMGSFDPSTGVFSADLEIPDPDGEMRKTLEIRVSDDVGNSETRKVALTNGALSEIRSIALTFDGATVGGNIKSTEAVSGKIGAVAVMNDGTIIKLNNDDLDFSFTAVSGEAELKDGGEFTASKGAQGIITARLAATDSAFYSSSACFGAENNGFTGTVSVSSTVGGKVTGAGTGGGENKKASLRASAGEKVRVKLPAGVSASDYLPYYSDVDLNKTFIPVSAVIDGYVVFIAPVSATYYFGQNRKTFVDISGHWGESYIDFAAERDILKGVGENLFDPDGTMTRAMFTTRAENAAVIKRFIEKILA